jgi:hypothetical protein
VPGTPGVLFVFPTDAERGRRFFGSLWPEARAVSDPELALYRGFGLGRAGPLQLLSLGAVTAGIRSLAQGNPAGLPQGDPFQLPGLWIVRGGRVLWEHRYRHIGDHPDFRRLAEHAG